jgi:hypothetical protein
MEVLLVWYSVGLTSPFGHTSLVLVSGHFSTPDTRLISVFQKSIYMLQRYQYQYEKCDAN